MINYKNFVNAKKSLIIAPAWYWKTHTISESLKHTNGRQLILTHTHAWISSIKEKLKKANISSKNYNVETISSFAQKFVISFYIWDDIPNQEDTQNYYFFIIAKATELFKLNLIQNIINISYSWLFVDEYQDCTESQHNLILELSNILPTHILWDYLQWIFNFNPVDDPIINLEDNEKLKDFYDNFQELEIPWRWKIWWNEDLWLELKNIRWKLNKKENIDLNIYEQITFIKTDDIYRGLAYSKIFKIIIENKNLLIIDSISTSINTRISFLRKFKNSCFLLESIDDRDFYSFSKKLDSFTKESIYKDIIGLSSKILSSKTELRKWFNLKNNSLKSKRNIEDKKILDNVKKIFIKIEENFSYNLIAHLLILISKIPNIKIYRKDLFYSLVKSLKDAEFENISVYEAMVNKRNLIRRIWNRIEWRCVGTTLLTKWLEFDTVLIINAHKFECPKDLYVALTRASNKLIIFSESNILSPYK